MKLTRHIHVEATALYVVRIRAVGIIPHAGNFHGPTFDARYLGRNTALLFYVSLDYLGGNAAGKLAMLAAFKQDRHYDAGVAPGFHAHEPGIVLHGVRVTHA